MSVSALQEGSLAAPSYRKAIPAGSEAIAKNDQEHKVETCERAVETWEEQRIGDDGAAAHVQTCFSILVGTLIHADASIPKTGFMY